MLTADAKIRNHGNECGCISDGPPYVICPCKECVKDPCYNQQLQVFDDVIYNIDLKIVEYSKSVAQRHVWGYGCETDIDPDEFLRLRLYKDVLLRHYDTVSQGFEPFLCPYEIQLVLEKARLLVDNFTCTFKNRQDIQIDKSKYDEWVSANPNCIAYEDWARPFMNECPKFGIEVLNKEVIEDFYFMLSVEKVGEIDYTKLFYILDVYRHVKECKLKYDVSLKMLEGCKLDFNVSTKRIDDCRLKYDVSVNTLKECFRYGINVEKIDECKLNYDLLIKEHNCDLSFDTYLKLLTCDISSEMIVELYDCGIGLDYSVSQACPILVFDDKSLAISSFNIKLDSVNYDCTKLSELLGQDVCNYDKSEVEEILLSYSNLKKL